MAALEADLWAAAKKPQWRTAAKGKNAPTEAKNPPMGSRQRVRVRAVGK
jgi:hypothetical protein